MFLKFSMKVANMTARQHLMCGIFVSSWLVLTHDYILATSLISRPQLINLFGMGKPHQYNIIN